MHRHNCGPAHRPHLEPEAERHGFELVAVEQAGGRGTPVVRVLLDREGGIDLDAIAEANAGSRRSSSTRTAFTHAYTLEVSSPGIDRPLTKREDFARFVGETVQLRVATRPRGASRGRAISSASRATTSSCSSRRRARRIPYDDHHVKARLKGVVDFGKGREQSDDELRADGRAQGARA